MTTDDQNQCCAQTLITAGGTAAAGGSCQSIPGPRGAKGDTGATGSTGANGVSAFTTLTAGAVMPAVNGNVIVSVGTSAWIAAGQIVYVENTGYFSASGIASGVVTLTNLGYSTNASPGAAIASGSKLTPSAPKGASAPDEARGYILLRRELANNTDGGTFTQGAWRARLLNTISKDTRSQVVSLVAATGVFTLKPGRYRFRASSPANKVHRHRVKLRDITNGTQWYGTSEFTGDTGQTSSYVTGSIDIPANSEFVLEHECEQTKADNGFGVAADFDQLEVYEWIELEERNQ